MCWLMLVAVGFAAAVVQVVVARELMVGFSGNELAIGLTMAGWLAGVAWGAASAGRYLTRRRAAVRTLAWAAGLALPFAGLAALALARLGRHLLLAPPGALVSPWSLALVTVSISLVVAFPVGLSFPPLARLVRSPSLAYGLEASGGLVGGLVVTWALTEGAGGVWLLVWTAAVVAGAVALAGGRAVALVAGLLAVLGVSPWPGALDRSLEALRLDAMVPSASLVRTRDTRRARVDVALHGGRTMILVNGQLVAVTPDPRAGLEEAHLACLAHPAPASVLLVGPGYSGILAHLLEHPGVSRVDVVDMDPGVPDVVAGLVPRVSALLDPRVTFVAMDPRLFLADSPQKAYDLMVFDVPDPVDTALNRMYTMEFFQLARSRLADPGVLVTSVSAGVNVLSREQALLSGSLREALARVFPEVVVLPGDRHRFLAGTSRGTVPKELDSWKARWAERRLGELGFTLSHLLAGLRWSRVEGLAEGLDAIAAIPNTDLHPVATFYALSLWSWRAGDRGPALIASLSPSHLGAAALVAVLLALLLTSGHDRAARRRAALLHMGTSGFAGMSVELLVLWSYQSRVGEVYSVLGALVASFMAGLAATSLVSARLMRESEPGWWRGALVDGGWLVLLAVAWGLSGWRPAGSVTVTTLAHLLAMALAGGLTGLSFPVAVEAYAEAAPPGRALPPAAAVDWADHAGAAAGALLIQAFALPLLGLGWTLLGLVGFKVASGVGWWRSAAPGTGRGPGAVTRKAQ